MLLYLDLTAPNPRRVRIFFAEKGVTYETVTVSIQAKQHQSAPYLAKNPLGLLPILELADGRVLRESMAICRYLEELYPEPNLFGRDPWERAQIEQWNRHAELELLFPTVAVFRNLHPFWSGRIEQAPDYGEIMKGVLAQRLQWLESELARRPFLAGERFSVADISAICAIDFARVSNIRIDPATQPNLSRWHQLVSERPSVQSTRAPR